MQPLSALDSAFLFLETADTPMHIASMHVLSMPKSKARGFVTAVRKHMRSRLHLAPALTRVLGWMPFNLSSPYWQAAEKIDMNFHVRKLQLPAPGGHRELDDLIAMLHSELMDRSKPLWQMTIIEGLGKELQTEPGKHCVGLYSRVHHAAVDGQGGIALASAVFDITEQGRAVNASKKAPAKKLRLGLAEVLSGAISHQLAQAMELAKRVPDTVKMLNAVREKSTSTTKKPSRTSTNKEQGRLLLAPRTKFNRAVNGERAFNSVHFSLQEIKVFGKAHEASINDVVMAMITGALRAYLKQHGGVPKQPLVAAVPVSLRASGDASSNNQAAMITVKLPTHLSTAKQQLRAISEKTRAMKSSIGSLRGAVPTDFPTLGLPWLIGGLSKLYARTRMANRVPPIANVVISNVPGPQFPLYVAGAKLLSYVPVSIVAQGLALNITVQSYDGHLHFGLISCAKTVPDSADFAEHVQEAWQALQQVAQSGTSSKSRLTRVG